MWDRRRSILAFALFTMLHTGCSQNPSGATPENVNASAKSQSVQQDHRLIGVAASPDLNITGVGIEPSIRLQGPQVGDGFWAGASRGSGYVIEAGIATAPAPTAVAGLLLWPVGAIAGGIGGAVSESTRIVDRPLTGGRGTEAELGKELKNTRIEQALRDQITQVGQGLSRHRLITLPHESFSVEVVSYRGNSHIRKILIECGIDAVLDLHVTRFALAGRSADDPSLALELNVRSLWYVHDMPIQFDEWEFNGQERKLSTWTSNGYHLLREELDRAIHLLAVQIVEGTLQAGS